MRWMQKRKQREAEKNCQHVNEIVTRGKIVENVATMDADYYEITTATCIHCGKKEILNQVNRQRMIGHGELLEVIQDPRGIYEGIETPRKAQKVQ